MNLARAERNDSARRYLECAIEADEDATTDGRLCPSCGAPMNAETVMRRQVEMWVRKAELVFGGWLLRWDPRCREHYPDLEALQTAVRDAHARLVYRKGL